MSYIKCEFKDQIVYVDADKLEDGGCVELQPDRSDEGISWAYLSPVPDSKIRQYQSIIGHMNDLKIIIDEDEKDE